MSKTEIIKIWREGANNMKICGVSLAKSLYHSPITIRIEGKLGAGKTTFIQGFAKGLGIREPITSPTYALEQRYQGIVPLIHIDLYRLSKEEATKLIESTDDFEGIRCIEWAQRIGIDTSACHGEPDEPDMHIPTISIVIEEPQKDTRELTIVFNDVLLPSRDQIESWRTEVMLPAHIWKHCDVVGSVAEHMAHSLLETGRITRPLALRRSGELHDLLRFMDFRPDASPPGMKESCEEQECWKKWKERYPNLHHEAACAAFLREKNLDALAEIIEPHGLLSPSPLKSTTEQKILFYADKRVIVDRVVSLEERFEDFKKRYGKGKETPQHVEWFREARTIEKELFPEGVPL